MTEIRAKAFSDDIGLRRESTLDIGGLPLWLARLHRSLPVEAGVQLSLRGTLPVARELLFEGAGFIDEGDKLVRQRTLPDMLAPNLRAVVVGINPSFHSADAGYGYAGPGNRFWEAAAAAGLVSTLRSPEHSLTHESVGFTDLVKRATSRAADITASEFQAGLVRLDQIFDWVRPRRIIVAGITGWRQATGQPGSAGWQKRTLGGRPIYLMPNPSGLNARTTLDDLIDHLRTALDSPLPPTCTA